MYNDSYIAKRMTKRRKEIGKTQEDVQVDIGIKRTNYSKWEKGSTVPGTRSLALICNALDCDIEYLLGAIESPHRETHDAADVTGLSRESIEVLAALNKSKSYTANIRLNIIDKLIKSDTFLNEVLSHLTNAQLALNGEDSASGFTFPDLERIEIAKDTIEQANFCGNTKYTVYSGKDSATLQIQSAANATQMLYRQIIEDEVKQIQKKRAK